MKGVQFSPTCWMIDDRWIFESGHAHGARPPRCQLQQQAHDSFGAVYFCKKEPVVWASLVSQLDHTFQNIGYEKNILLLLLICTSSLGETPSCNFPTPKRTPAVLKSCKECAPRISTWNVHRTFISYVCPYLRIWRSIRLSSRCPVVVSCLHLTHRETHRSSPGSCTTWTVPTHQVLSTHMLISSEKLATSVVHG